MDLFTRQWKNQEGTPLAERMRPQTLGEFKGQSHLLGPHGLLSRLLGNATNHTPPPLSFILWGPPGSGKTTLAQLLAKSWNASLITLSAVHSGVKELRQAMEEAKEKRIYQNQKTILFIDEIHRYHKGQQDALLPQIETGTITLIGATTENPSFELNGALLSRCRVLKLEALSKEELRLVIKQAILDKDKGLGNIKIHMEPTAEDRLIQASNGDARRALSALETAVSLVKPDEALVHHIDEATIEQALQQRVFLYDKAGDEHYHTVSAFIKSMRGSDPDAALYWMARMLEAGEDPFFVLRRMVIFAAEDIGCADPQALTVSMSTVEAVRFLGFPEGTLPMSQLAIYLSTAKKDNAALTAYAAAKDAVTTHGHLPVPFHLRNSHSGSGKTLGHGKEYKSPHRLHEEKDKQQYLPDVLRNSRFYHRKSKP